jgi:hypothetical protein
VGHPNPKVLHIPQTIRRPRFSFFLTNNVKKPTNKYPSPDPTFLSNLAQAFHKSSGKILLSAKTKTT